MNPTPALSRELQAGALALQRRDPAAAASAARRALQLAGDHADAWNLLGLALAQQRQAAEAIAALERAVAARPAYRNAWDNLIALLQQSGSLERAAATAERALQACAPGSAVDWHRAGLLLHRAGDATGAGRCVEVAVQRDPASRRYRHDLAVIRFAEQRIEDARALIAELVASPQATLEERANFVAIWTRATAPADLERALEQAALVLAAQAGNVRVLDSTAILLGKLHRRTEALEFARRALAADPGSAGALYTLARLLDEDGQHQAALEALQARPELQSRDARLPRLEGSLHLKRDAAAPALAALDRTLAQTPADQTAIALRGVALYQLGRTAEARDWWGLERFLSRVVLDTPAGFASRPAWLAALAADIRQHSRLRFEPIGLAAQGGWLTDELLADRTPAILGFHEALRAAIRAYLATLPVDPAHPFLRVARSEDWTMHLWATRSVEGGVIDTHLHDDSWLSGAFYVELPPGMGSSGAADPHAGWIEFGQPHRGLPDVPAEALRRYPPAVGELLLFPSYLYHRTLPFRGSGERISISFDLAFAH
jgi:uncharacterized protein (TIGR02466 family)